MALTGPLRRAATTTTASSSRPPRSAVSRQLLCSASNEKTRDGTNTSTFATSSSARFSRGPSPVSSLHYRRRGAAAMLPSPSVWAWQGLSTSAAQREEVGGVGLRVGAGRFCHRCAGGLLVSGLCVCVDCGWRT